MPYLTFITWQKVWNYVSFPFYFTITYYFSNFMWIADGHELKILTCQTLESVWNKFWNASESLIVCIEKAVNYCCYSSKHLWENVVHILTRQSNYSGQQTEQHELHFPVIFQKNFIAPIAVWVPLLHRDCPANKFLELPWLYELRLPEIKLFSDHPEENTAQSPSYRHSRTMTNVRQN